MNNLNRYLHTILFILSIAAVQPVCANDDSWNNNSKNYHFYFQNVFGSGVTLNKVKSLFGDISPTVEMPVQFNSGTTIEEIDKSIKNNKLDLLIWGYSDVLNNFMLSNGYKQLLISPMDVFIYEFNDTAIRKNQPKRIALLADSTAYYTAKHYYNNKNDQVTLVTFDNYFSLIQACFRKEVDHVVAVSTFLMTQPGSLKQKFKRVGALPPIASLSIWNRADTHPNQDNQIVDYFISKQAIMSDVIGTGKIKRAK